MASGWYPGHIARARRYITANIRTCHVIFELVDARIPRTSRSHRMQHLWKGKAHLLILTREDLADPQLTWAWTKLYQEEGTGCLAVDLTSARPDYLLDQVLSRLPQRITARLESSGSVRAMVIGLPNVGKSTFINAISGRGSAPSGRQPGVTRGQKWIAVQGGLRLLDLPGVLPPRGVDSEEEWWRLAAAGLIPPQVFDPSEVAYRFLSDTSARYPELFSERYGLEAVREPLSLMEDIGRVRGCLKAGGRVDLERASSLILSDYQSGRLGRMTLDRPGECEE